MSISKQIITHLIGFSLTFLFSCLLIGYYLFQSPANQPFPLSQFFSFNHLQSMINHREVRSRQCFYPDNSPTKLPQSLTDQGYSLYGPIGSQSNSWLVTHRDSNGSWSLSRYNEGQEKPEVLVSGIIYPEDKLLFNTPPINSVVVYPDCPNRQCYLNLYHLDDGRIDRLPAFTEPGHQPTDAIHDLIYDEQAQIISYGTNRQDTTSRLVINHRLELLHSIDESPGLDRQLVLLGYLPEYQSLVYFDPNTNQQYHYKLTGIGLYRLNCNQGEFK